MSGRNPPVSDRLAQTLGVALTRECAVSLQPISDVTCFAEWAAESNEFAKEVVVNALAHKIPNQVQAAYRRTDIFDKRPALMAKRSEFVIEANAKAS